ncbi:MAG: hypothetical protein EBR82_17545 [Caulobacteraceae bacterium]|nr:hypothetical protein [Caulobacteraceae bacterium]
MTAYRLQILDDSFNKLADQLLGAETHISDLEARAAALRPSNGVENPAICVGKLFKVFHTKTKQAMAIGDKGLGIEAVVNVFVDAIQVADRFEKTLADGFQFLDLMQILTVFPTLQEMYADRKVFITELLDLTPDESAEVLAQVSVKTGLVEGVVKEKAIAAIDLINEAYALVAEVETKVKVIAAKAKALAA